MNKLLAETVSVLNGFFALLTVVACGVAGKYLAPYCVRLYAQLNGLTYAGSQSQVEVLGILCGLAVGFFWAALVYGLIALFVQMHRELKTIRRQLTDTSALRAPTYPLHVVPRTPALAS